MFITVYEIRNGKIVRDILLRFCKVAYARLRAYYLTWSVNRHINHMHTHVKDIEGASVLYVQ